jgi:predicted phage-related endonuclease
MATRTTIPKPPDREEWLAARRPWFNASAAAVLFDRHPYLTPGAYATIKLTGEEPPITRPMIRGQMLEDIVAAWWAEENGYKLWEPTVMFACDRLLYSADRITRTEVDPFPHTTGDLVEVKTATGYVREPLDYWIDQCQAGCVAANKPGVHLVWLDSSLDYAYLWVERDEAHGTKILEGAEWFMSFIDMGMEPEGVVLTYAQRATVHPIATTAKVELDDEGYQWVRALNSIRHARQAAERDEDRIKAEIGRRLGEAEEGWWQGAPVVTWRNDKPSTRLDAKALTKARPDVAVEFMVTRVGTRRMLVVGSPEPEEEEAVA